MSAVLDRLRAAGLELPAPPKPQGDYASVVIHRGVAYVAGQLSRTPDGVIRGPVDSCTPEALIQRAAEASVTRAISALQGAVSDLDLVERILFLRGFVHAAWGFEQHSWVLDHVSAVVRIAFGDNGIPARSAVGVSSLPSCGLVEIELVAALRKDLA
jgi:enamine deaminase RidA (YjgF/YER057c/UK114 family)